MNPCPGVKSSRAELRQSGLSRRPSSQPKLGLLHPMCQQVECHILKREASDLECGCYQVSCLYLWEARVSLNYHKPLFATAKRDLSTFPPPPQRTERRDNFSSHKCIICKLNINEDIFDGSATILMTSDKNTAEKSPNLIVFDDLNFYRENFQMFWVQLKVN